MRYHEITEAVDPASIGTLSQELPDRYLHRTHDQTMVESIVRNGFDLKHFGYTGKKYNAAEWTRFDPAGVYAMDDSEVMKHHYPWVRFVLKGRPMGLTSRFSILGDLARAYGCIGFALTKELLKQDIKVIQSVREFIILDPSIIEIVDWSKTE